jgi:magnesium-transporting ATPase (P-type)
LRIYSKIIFLFQFEKDDKDKEIAGLSSKQATDLRKIHGSNDIPEPRGLPAWLCCLIPCLRGAKARQYFEICIPDTCTVLRNQKWILMDSLGLVPGDVVKIQPKDRVPADIRVVKVILRFFFTL